MLDNLIIDTEANPFNAEWSETHTADPFCEMCDGVGTVMREQYGEIGVGSVWMEEDCDCTKY